MPITPLQVLNSARSAVPAVNYALGVAGIAAAGSIIILVSGNTKASIIVISLVFVGMLLLFAFSRLVSAGGRSTFVAGTVLLWAVLIFFITFLTFTATSFAFAWPKPWAQFLGIAFESSQDSKSIVHQGFANEALAMAERFSPPILSQLATSGRPKSFSPPKLKDRTIDGCIASPFFPEEEKAQCLNSAQELIASTFCRSNGFSKSTAYVVQTYGVIHPSFKLSFSKNSDGSAKYDWLRSDASGSIFDTISCI